jgi:hypothetical protein
MLIDQSVANATFNASGDIRFTGVVPWQQTYIPGTPPVATLQGMIAANGNLTFNAGQLYPTTGSTFTITSSAANGTITFGRSSSDTPAAPYSAGGNLTVQAANIVQDSVIRVPLGTLTLGSDTADGAFAPATQSVVLADGGITSVSADGLVIPYGTTTDQTEWFFAPTGSDPLTGPPSKLLNLGGSNVTISSGATVDLTGGGDVYAYEFVPGTGGSRDVLDRMNPDQFTSNNGFQYPDGRQVYAIVPGLSNSPVAAYDPIYSSDYGNLSSVSGAGARVWLNGGNGLVAGWYTLLPAKYAMLPGGMRVVEQTDAKNVFPGLNGMLLDGTIVTSGHRHRGAASGIGLAALGCLSDCSTRHDRCRRGGNPVIARCQSCGVANYQCSKYPGAGDHHRRSGDPGPEHRRLGDGVQRHRRHPASCGAADQCRLRPAVNHHRRGVGLWRFSRKQ